MNRRGKHVALSTVAVGVVVLVAAGFSVKDRFAEEWYLRRLNGTDYKDARFAAHRLVEMKSRRAIPSLLEWWVKHSHEPQLAAGWPAFSFSFFGSYGEEAIPALIAVLKQKEDEVGFQASIVLRGMGETAATALVQELGTDDLKTHVAVLNTLAGMGTSAIPALSDGVRSTDDRIRDGSRSALEVLMARIAREKSRLETLQANPEHRALVEAWKAMQPP